MSQALNPIIHNTGALALKPVLEVKAPKKPELEITSMSFVKHFFYLILSVALTAGIFLFEGELALLKADQNIGEQSFVLTVEGNNRVELFREGSDLPEQFLGKILLKEGDTIQSKASSNVTIKLPHDSVIRVDEDTNLLVKKADFDKNSFYFELQNGQLWANNLHNSSHIFIEGGGAVMQPLQAVFNVKRVDETLDVQVFRHQLHISFFDDQGEYLNDFYVSEGNKVLVPLGKLTPVIAKLFYSKLIKEFKYSLFQEADVQKSTWFKQNLAKDQKLATTVRDREMEQISLQGLKNSSIDSLGFEFKSYFNENLRSLLTIFDEKKKAVFTTYLFDHIDDAIYLAEQGTVDESTARVEFFDLEKNNSFFQTFVDIEHYKKALEERINRLIFVGPTDDLYLVKEYLLRQRLLLPEEDVSVLFPFLQYYLDDVYDSARLDYDKANVILDNYFQALFNVLNQNQGAFASHLHELQVQNHFIDNLFVRYPVFYKKSFFQKKIDLENQFLLALAEGVDKNEERQSLISKKIDLLKRLQFFFFEKEAISLADAKGVVGVLINGVQDMLPANTSQVAIKKFFEETVTDFNLFWEFLNTDEYSASSLYGDTNKERFEAYLKAQEQDKNIESVLDNFISAVKDQKPEKLLSAAEIVKRVKQDFYDIFAENLTFDEDIADGARYIKITGGEVAGYNFEGVYDRDQKTLAEVYVGGNLISKSGVKLNNLETLIKSKFDTFKDSSLKSSDDLDSAKPLTEKQKLLKLLFIKKLDNFSLKVPAEKIEILNEDTSSFHVAGLEISNHPEALYSFDVLYGRDFATNAVILTLKHQIKINEEVSLAKLESQISAAYDQYLKQLEDGKNGTSTSKPKVKRSTS